MSRRYVSPTIAAQLAASILIARRARKEGRKPVFTLTEEKTVTEDEKRRIRDAGTQENAAADEKSRRRIYVVTNSADSEQQLIRATSPAAARNFAARIYSAELATQEDLVRLCAKHSVQDAE